MLVGVWEENRGCESRDALNWPGILQNLTLWKNFAHRSIPKAQQTRFRDVCEAPPVIVKVAAELYDVCFFARECFSFVLRCRFISNGNLSVG